MTRLRWSGVALAVLAVVWAVRTPAPNVLISADGRTFAVRGADGRLAFHHGGGDTFAVREWLAADADGRDVHDTTLGAGVACDPAGCLGKLADGGLVSYVLAPDAFEEDFRGALLVVTTRDAPPHCAATAQASLWRRRALRVSTAPGALRPARSGAAGGPEAAAEAPTASPAPPRDATPRPEDLQPDD